MSATQGKIKLTYNGRPSGTKSFEISKPLFGYTTTIDMQIAIKQMPNGKIYTFDHTNGSDTNDRRACKADFILTESEMTAFDAAIFESESRGQIYLLDLDGYGFFPFGADKGDSGQFTILLKVSAESTRLKTPYNRYMLSVEMVNAGAYPEYTITESTDTGAVTIGNVTNIRYPDSFPSAKISRTDSGIVIGGRTGIVKATDAYTNNIAYTDIKKSDSFAVDLSLRLGTNKTAELLNELTNTETRKGDFTFSCGLNSYPFGIQAGSGEFTASLLSNTISVTHTRHNQFNTSLQIGKQP